MVRVALTFFICLIFALLAIVNADVEWKPEYSQYAVIKCQHNDGIKRTTVDMKQQLTVVCTNGAVFKVTVVDKEPQP